MEPLKWKQKRGWGQATARNEKLHSFYLVVCISGIKGALYYWQRLSLWSMLISKIILFSVRLADWLHRWFPFSIAPSAVPFTKESEFVNPSLAFGCGHVTRFGLWDVGSPDASRSFKKYRCISSHSLGPLTPWKRVQATLFKGYGGREGPSQGHPRPSSSC